MHGLPKNQHGHGQEWILGTGDILSYRHGLPDRPTTYGDQWENGKNVHRILNESQNIHNKTWPKLFYSCI